MYSTKSLLISLVLLSLYLNSIDCFKAYLLNDIEFEGGGLDIEVNGCVNLPNYWNDIVSAVYTNNHCMRLYEDSDCHGRFLTLHPGSPSQSNLRDFNFDDILSSVSDCNYEQ